MTEYRTSGGVSRTIRKLVFIALVALSSPAYAQSSNDALLERMKSLEDAIRSLERQIVALNNSARLSPETSLAKLSNALVERIGAHGKGAPTARFAMIEYSDLECPFCAQFHREVFDRIDREFVQTGRIRYDFRHLPIEQIHRSARLAAEAVECAGEQDKFWEFKNRVFANQKALTGADLTNYAREEGLHVAHFQSCLLDGKMTNKVQEDLDGALRLGLNGTPAFLLGKIEDDGRIQISNKIVGAQPFSTFKAALDALVHALSVETAR